MHDRAALFLGSWLEWDWLSSKSHARQKSTHAPYNFSAVIEPIARGMLDVARSPLRGTHCRVSGPHGPGWGHFASNPSEWRLGEQSPTVIIMTGSTGNQRDFVPDGLNVRLLTLQCHEGRASLRVALPYRKGDAMSDAAFTMLHINREGSTNVQSFNPFINPTSYALEVVGFEQKMPNMIDTDKGSSPLSDSALGYSGAVGHLQMELPELGSQLSDWAYNHRRA